MRNLVGGSLSTFIELKINKLKLFTVKIENAVTEF
jgi:hypothetical protein